MEVWRESNPRPAHDPSWSVGSLVDGWDSLSVDEKSILLDERNWNRRVPLTRQDVSKILNKAQQGAT
jgi:hypothetical protein